LRYYIPIFLLSFFILVTSGCNSLFFYPKKEHLQNPVIDQHSPEDIFFRSVDGIRLHGWFLRPEKRALGTILFFHGNAENVSTHVNSVLWLVKAGYQVFIFDYRGYGRSGGQPTMAGIHRDASAAVEAIFRIAGVRGDRIIFFGQSLGGAVAVYTLASSPFRDRVKALVIDSSFSSYRKIAREKIASLIVTWPLQYPLGFLVTDRYSPERWIARVSPVPLLIVHGDSDRVVPMKHAELLFRKAREPKQFYKVQGAGHIQAFEDEGARKRLLFFLSSLLHR
jgi:fermentation-respiration switch protein FrsA (DUF1100 family)